jgi:hypothetical protein
MTAIEQLKAHEQWLRDHLQNQMAADLIKEAYLEIEYLQGEVRRQNLLLNTPENHNFTEGVMREAAHQVERWGTQHDAGKQPQDFFWLIGYLAGKALRSSIDGDTEKAMHHCISTSAVCANWHRHLSGSETTFTPGLPKEPMAPKPAAPAAACICKLRHVGNGTEYPLCNQPFTPHHRHPEMCGNTVDDAGLPSTCVHPVECHGGEI